MTYYGEYTTLADLRSSGEGAQLVISSPNADNFLMDLIQEISSSIEDMCDRKFAPYVATQYYDAPVQSVWHINDVLQSRGGTSDILRIDTDDLLTVTTLTNGDGTVITAAQYLLYPANSYPKQSIALVPSSGVTWQPNSSGDSGQVISLAGVFGYHTDYASAWRAAGTIADVGGITAVATSYTASSGHGLKLGHLIQMDSEYCYVANVVGLTITLDRGANGSTAAAHDAGTPVTYWRPHYTVARTTRAAVAAHYNLRANPVGSSTTVNGVTFNTPYQVEKWIASQLAGIGLPKVVVG